MRYLWGLTYTGIAYEGHYEDLWMISCLFKVAQRPQGTVLLGYVATGIVLTFDGSSLQDVYRRAIGKGAAVEKSIGRQHQLRFFFSFSKASLLPIKGSEALEATYVCFGAYGGREYEH